MQISTGIQSRSMAYTWADFLSGHCSIRWLKSGFLAEKTSFMTITVGHDVTASTAPGFGGISLVALIPVRDPG
ncbi:hypothetical protein [Paracoccus sp. PAMC 22219]|uniref:hypothetical protein n=1 Tax=Paracoccus sp. PAMC 22219 TaxID=1569209 RepID=UPI0012E0387E|nr:hypothetical protein [Paracoccus sp. PAMC 22219]